MQVLEKENKNIMREMEIKGESTGATTVVKEKGVPTQHDRMTHVIHL